MSKLSKQRFKGNVGRNERGLTVGRPIKPVSIRRLTDGGPIEVQSTSGFWVGVGMLGASSLDALNSALAANGHGSVLYLQGTEAPFEYSLGEAPDDDDDLPTPQGKGGKGDGGQGGEGEGEAPQSPLQGMIDQIVRQIATELDDAQGEDLAEQMSQFVTHPELDATVTDLKTWVSNHVPDGKGSGLYAVTTKIQVKLPDDQFDKQGLFHKNFDLLTQCVSIGQHCYLPGEPGTGKSHAAEQIASMLGWRFASISLGPTTPESRLWGGMDAHGKFFEPPFVTLARYAQDNPDKGSIFCLDELDNGHPGIIATLNSAMANGWFTAPNGDVIVMGKNMVLIGAANTFGTGPTAEFAGRNKLDAATLDRFVFIPWPTDEGVEAALVKGYLDDGDDHDMSDMWLDVWRTARKNVADNGLKLFVTMRGAVNGARLVAGGIDMEQAFGLVLGNKVPADQLKKINPF